MISRNLKTFMAVARCGSITQAAQSLHVTQPAVSCALSALEDRLGVKLFFRDRHKRAVLTPAGERILKLAEEMETINRRLFETASLEKGDLSGSLRVATISALVSPVVSKLLKRFREKFPAVRIEIIETSPNRISRLLEERQADVAVSCAPFGAFEVEVLLADRIVAVANAKDLSSGMSAPVDLFDEKTPFVLNRAGMETIADHLPAVSRPSFGGALRVETAESAVELVRDGFGIGILSAVTAASLAPDLMVLDVRPQITFDIGVMTIKGEKTLAAEAFLALARRRLFVADSV